jgi:hypothetical protein
MTTKNAAEFKKLNQIERKKVNDKKKKEEEKFKEKENTCQAKLCFTNL